MSDFDEALHSPRTRRPRTVCIEDHAAVSNEDDPKYSKRGFEDEEQALSSLGNELHIGE